MNVPVVVYSLLGVASSALLIVIIGLAVGVRGGDIACLLWAGVAIIIAMIPLCLDIGRPEARRHIFLSMLSISYLVHYVVPVLVYYIPAVGPVDPAAMGYTNLLPQDVARGEWMAILGLVFFFAGYAAPIRALIRPILPTRFFDWTQNGALLAACLWTFSGWLVFIGGTVGLIPAALGTGWLGGFSSGTLFGSALLAATYLKFRSRLALQLMFVLIPMTSLVMFMTGSKTLVLMPTAMVVMTWVVVQRRIRMRWIAAGILAITFLYPVAQFWRQDILQNGSLRITDVIRNPGPALQRTALFLSDSRTTEYFVQGFEAAGKRLDAIGVSSVIIRDTPAVSPFQNGRTLALVPIGLIPRIFWPGKPKIPIGDWVSRTYTPYGYLTDTNLSVSWIGEFYLNFGIVGVAIGMYGLGFLLRSIHESLIRPNMSIPLIAASVILLSRLLLGVQGSLSGIINNTIILLIPLFLVHLLVRTLGAVHRISAQDPQS